MYIKHRHAIYTMKMINNKSTHSNHTAPIDAYRMMHFRFFFLFGFLSFLSFYKINSIHDYETAFGKSSKTKQGMVPRSQSIYKGKLHIQPSSLWGKFENTINQPLSRQKIWRGECFTGLASVPCLSLDSLSGRHFPTM